jgi:hypothetical protein
MNISAYEQFGFVLQKSGSNWKMCCPFHKEDTPSFMVYSDASYHCFGCHAHGSYEDFVMFFSGDSNRIFYVTSLDDIQSTREEREVGRVKRKLEAQIIAALNEKGFETKELTWNFFDRLFLQVAFMRDNSAAFMETILFIKREGNTILKRILNEC